MVLYKHAKVIAAILFAVLINAGCIKQAPPSVVPEIRPGVLQGYLVKDDYPDSLALLPPPPEKGSVGFAMDEAISKKALGLQDTSRFALAAKDAELIFPEAAQVYSCTLGIPISEEHTPHLYMLLRRVLADAGLTTYAAKDHYNRARPFVINGFPTCTPDEEEHLSHDGSYPSGHTAVGWAWALVLTEVVPEQADAILQRGRAYGESRIACNVHWYSDVVAGRMIGAAAVARMHGNAEFREAVEAARNEVIEIRKLGLSPSLNCQAEKEALKIVIHLQ
ncbi:acid phosphatase (class A) [Maridesulfovibrio ferrireducens]|uniref:Acid phosphatase n=1 Tax=Maridesulfovibrio ferrireducens TaxID=246191 RepID=A0A1G9E8C7_9BACT|nr:phosphatase PAP2 family protein [Maridesulfovibrio ferrireducens]SDK72347.1 acid phosphatase (class A) [Maridesulfovibrio ferrireducens]